jgi:cyclin-dependent kinase regulatory subunit CKS1
MPHYPDEIEYSDKYMDDYYEYRHVILPKDVYKRLPRSRLLSESVIVYPCRNGDSLACSSRGAGFTMSFISQNRIFCSLGEPREVTLRLVYRLPDLWLRPIRSSFELVIILQHYHHINFSELLRKTMF